MDKTFSNETEFKKQEFEKQHKTLNTMVNWLKTWEKYTKTENKRQIQNNGSTSTKRRR